MMEQTMPNTSICIECGKCTGRCPISLKSSLNISKVINAIKRGERKEFKGDDRAVWECSSCCLCELNCPKGVETLEVVREVRSLLVESGNVPSTIRDALKSTEKIGNPFQMSRKKRNVWANNLNIENLLEEGNSKNLYFVGCAPAYDPRVQEVAKDLTKIFQKIDFDFGYLGNEEFCCGNEISNLGEKGLFELLIEKNLTFFNQAEVEKIITTSPHCFNAFLNKYPESLERLKKWKSDAENLSIDFEVYHYTMFLDDLLKKGELELLNGSLEDLSVTYHDPCYLGYHNEIFEEPRNLIQATGVKLREMKHSRHLSVCCEGGGGRMWYDSESTERLGVKRIKEAVSLDVDAIVTCCPFCILNLEDAVKVSGYEDEIEVMDIAELLMLDIE